MDKYQVQQAMAGNFQIIPAIGGQNTYRERSALGFGEKSLVQNMRCWNPGFETRNGYTKLSTTATNASQESVLNIYQLSKGKRSEQAVFVQYGNGLLHKQNGSIPTQYTGTFGTVAFTGVDPGTMPASFSTINDYMIYANGTDQHKIYAGSEQLIDAFWVCRDTGAHDLLPNIGIEYTDEVSDGSTDTFAAVNMGDLAADYDAIYVMSKTPIDQWDVTVKVVNGVAGVLQMHYWTGKAWTTVAITDNTADSGKTLAQSGSIVTTTLAPARTTEVPRYMYGQNGYWYRLSLASGDIDAGTQISKFYYTTNSFVNLANVWNGVETEMIEAWFKDDSATVTYNYGGDSINMSDMTVDDDVYISSSQQLVGVFIDFSTTVQTTDAAVVISYWDGDSWVDTDAGPGGLFYDSTNGFRKSGWIIWALPTDETKQEFESTRYKSYVYKIEVDDTLSASFSVGITGMPSFDVSKYGQVGRVNGAWKNRALYTFDKYPRDIWVTESGELMKLNGTDLGFLEPGDGRDNATTAIVNFYNEIMVFQEELGTEGGCVTIFEGYSPSTFGKLVISTKVGTFSPKTVAVVDGSKTSQTQKELTAQTQVFFLSHYGVYMSDGKVVTGVSDQIQNYFDTRKDECIRTGYESEMWLNYDSTENVLKLGIVSGSSATVCNKFFIYDLVTGEWYEDTYSDSLSAWCEVQSDNGQFHTTEISGASTTGYIYYMNNGTNDDSVAIDAKLVWEFNTGPYLMDFEEILARVKVQGAATVYAWSVEENDVETDSGTKSMSAYKTGDTMRRNRILAKAHNIAWMSLTIQNDTLDESIYLYDLGILAKVTEYK